MSTGCKVSAGVFGVQVWLDADDSRQRVEDLVSKAKACGFSQLRIFLVWPFIEPDPGGWNFRVYDDFFNAALQAGLQVKATLTANSGPAHIGTPALLHSHTGFLDEKQMDRAKEYVDRCIRRYCRHPALGQWVIWNEPERGRERSALYLEFFRKRVFDRYGGDIGRLNQDWLTDYERFDQIPFPENILHPDQRKDEFHWLSFSPAMLELDARSAWLACQVETVAGWVRKIDPETPLCVNPTAVIGNQVVGGTNYGRIGPVVDVVGASYHPSWSFLFAPEQDHPALIALGLSRQIWDPFVQKVEVTELQCGEASRSGHSPVRIDNGRVERSFLAALASGAATVTGWAFNARSKGFEAGEWGLLNDGDIVGARCKRFARFKERVDSMMLECPNWRPVSPSHWILDQWDSQLLDAVLSDRTVPRPGRKMEDSSQGQALLGAELIRHGFATGYGEWGHAMRLTEKPACIIAAHTEVLDPALIPELDEYIRNGGTLILDALSFRKTPDTAVNRAWWDYTAREWGARSVGLQPGKDGWAITTGPRESEIGKAPLLRSEWDLDAHWRPVEKWIFCDDSTPVIWTRRYGKGQIFIVRILTGDSLLYAPELKPLVSDLFRESGAGIPGRLEVTPLEHVECVQKIATDSGELLVVSALSLSERGDQELILRGEHLDRIKNIYDPSDIRWENSGTVHFKSEDGIAVFAV